MSVPENEEEFKKQLFSRQLLAVGAEAQKKYSVCDVLVVGLTGLGLELVKNIVLSGVRSVTIVDDSPITWSDLSSLFYATPADVGKPRAATLLPKICELNRFVRVTVASAGQGADPNNSSGLLVSDDLLKQHTVAVFVDKRTTLLTKQNDRCRELGVKMVCCESRGVACSIFVDGGAEPFPVTDALGKPTLTLPIIDLEVTEQAGEGQNNKTFKLRVEIADSASHELGHRDSVYFSSIRGCTELNTDLAALADPSSGDGARLFTSEKTLSPFEFEIKLASAAAAEQVRVLMADSVYQGGGFVHTIRKRETVQFKSLEEAIVAPEFTMVDDADDKFLAAYPLHTIFRAIHDQMGSSDNSNAAAGFSDEQVTGILTKAKQIDGDVDEKLVRCIATAFHGNLNPMATFVGGVASQEVLKLASGKYRPIQQWLYYDMRELVQLRPANSGAADFAPRNTRYDGQVAVIGTAAQQKILNSSCFIVGAGALGCEHVKNVAMMGFGCGNNGSSNVTITDMDNIELSNLSRQFLFRQHHVQAKRSKSSVAAEAAKAMNADLKMTARELKVSAETEGAFNQRFFEEQAFILTALDNPAARHYIDSRCVMHHRPLFDSGTRGSTLSTQVVVPRVTAHYGAHHDPPAESFMVCTLKVFPNSIEHTIHWAKEAFGTEFTGVPSEVMSYVHQNAQWKAAVARDPSAKAGAMKQIVDALRAVPRSWEDCVAWARCKFEDYFVNEIKQLLYNLPIGSERDGKPVWGGAKRPPTAAVFDVNNKLHTDFIIAAASLRAVVYGVPPPAGSATSLAQELPELLVKVRVPEWQPRRCDVAVKDEEINKASGDAAAAPQQAVVDIKALNEAAGVSSVTEADLPPPEQFTGLKLQVQEFEKDDETNFHVDFMTAVSNLRATNYGIPVATRDHTKFIAGKIIPAMITTTAAATGLVGLELLKYIMGADKRELFRNSFCNLSQQSALVNQAPDAPPAPRLKYEHCENKCVTKEIGVWDEASFAVDCTTMLGGGKNRMRLKDMLRVIQVRDGIILDSLAIVTGEAGHATIDIPINEQTIRVPIIDLIEQLMGPERIAGRDFVSCAVSSCSLPREMQALSRALPPLLLKIK